jgi:predicted DsbA family dithiol-disulfide isomerase
MRTRLAVLFLFVILLGLLLLLRRSLSPQDANSAGRSKQAVAAVAAQSVSGGDSAKQPVAVVVGQTIYENELLPAIQAQLMTLRSQEYELKRKALDTVIEQKLLEAEAKKRGISTDKLLEQVAKITDPTDAELQAYYLAQADRFARPFEEVKGQLREGLQQAKIQRARLEFLKRLRATAGVTILLSVPKLEVAYDPARLRGNPSAPVIIVEFSDFQCPFCRQVQPTLRELLAKYPGRLSLAYRDYPLRQIHPQAQLAAEASRCAVEQGKFWEYHDLLFNSPNLDREALREHARALKLNEKQFDSCLAAGKYRPGVEQDFQEGTRVGISGTPGFFINGIPLSGAQPLESFVRVIDEELGRKR